MSHYHPNKCDILKILLKIIFLLMYLITEDEESTFLPNFMAEIQNVIFYRMFLLKAFSFEGITKHWGTPLSLFCCLFLNLQLYE